MAWLRHTPVEHLYTVTCREVARLARRERRAVRAYQRYDPRPGDALPAGGILHAADGAAPFFVSPTGDRKYLYVWRASPDA